MCVTRGEDCPTDKLLASGKIEALQGCFEFVWKEDEKVGR